MGANDLRRPADAATGGISESSAALGRRDVYAAIAIAAFFVGMLALTWNRWTIPLMDHGREMHVPARIVAGERLFLDIYYFYGPFAPYANAALYSVFGVHLGVLHGSGMACGAWILGVVYWLSRQLLSVTRAALATCLVLVLCAVSPFMGNYIQPYAYATLFGWTLAMTALACAVRYSSSSDGRWLLTASVLSGIAATCKPEMGLLGIAPSTMAWAVDCYERRQWLWRPAYVIVLPVTAISLLTYGALVWIVPWRLVVGQTYHSLSQPQMLYFSRSLAGLQRWPLSVLAMLMSLGLCLLGCSASVAWGMLTPSGKTNRSVIRLGRVAAIGSVLGSAWWLTRGLPDTFNAVQPLRAALLILTPTVLLCAWRIVTDRNAERSPYALRALFIIATFSLAAITRVFLNVSLMSPYVAFTVPPAIIVYTYLFLEVWPSRVPPPWRAGTAAAATALITATVVLMAWAELVYTRRANTTEIRTARGTIVTNRAVGEPLGEAIRFVRANTTPTEAVLPLPEGSVINFMADRPYPLPDEIIMPGYLTPDRERETIHTIDTKRVRLILILNRKMPEYRDSTFGLDYNQELMRWIENHYRIVATFGGGSLGDRVRLGDPTFFVRVYERVTD